MKTYADWLSATLASDAAEGRGVFPTWIGPLRPTSCIIGPALTVLISQDDNLAVRRAIAAPSARGSVLVVAGGSTSRTAVVGGLLALEMQKRGILALVTDGLVRDSREIRQLPFDVWCRGVTPVAAHKNGPASVGGLVSIGGTVICHGDLIIADDDGVVVWPKEQIDGLLVKAQAKLDQDNTRLAQLQKEL